MLPSLKLVSVLKTSGERKIRTFALAGLLTFTLSGCATLPADAPVEKVDYKACLITQDDAFGQAMGLNELSEYGVKQAVVTYGVGFESAASSKAKYSGDIKYLVKKKCSAIVVSGPDFVQLVGASAVANPEINFLYVAPTQDAANIDGSIGNLAVYGVDQYEAGLVQGYVGASLSKLHSIALYLQPEVYDGGIQAGVHAGVAIYDRENKTQTRVNIAGMLTPDYSKPGAADVALVPSNAMQEVGITQLKDSKVTIVSLGADLYENDLYKDLRSQFFTSIIPSVSDRIMEMVAADLEGEFVGGTLGSGSATYGNGGIKLTPEHEQNYSAGLLDSIKHFTLDYETKSR